MTTSSPVTIVTGAGSGIGRAVAIDLAARGHYLPAVDCTFTLAKIAAAHARVETGHKRGNVVVTMTDAA